MARKSDRGRTGQPRYQKSGSSKAAAPQGRPPTTGTAATQVTRKRLMAIVMVWVFIVCFFVGPMLMGNWLFAVPTVLFSAMAVATMRRARRPDSPDAEVLAPGALAAATTKVPVEVHGKWSAGGAVRAGAASTGLLRFADRRISFVTDEGEVTFEAPVNKVRMAAVPGFWRPQLDLDIDEVTHSIRFYPLWDLGATMVGPVVAGEWYSQLRALGAR